MIQVALRFDALPEPHTREGCRKCGCETGYLARYIQASRRAAVRLVCEWCEDYGTTSDLGRALVLTLGVSDIEELPVRVDRSHEWTEKPLKQCLACESWEQDIESHHWAPRAIFPDWLEDLVVPLCQNCHHDWHERMRQHGLRWPHELEFPPVKVTTAPPAGADSTTGLYRDPEDVPF